MLPMTSCDLGPCTDGFRYRSDTKSRLAGMNSFNDLPIAHFPREWVFVQKCLLETFEEVAPGQLIHEWRAVA